MNEEQIPESGNDRTSPTNEGAEPTPLADRFPELAEIEREVAARIRDNQRFLERFMDEDFAEEAEESGEEDGDFEEL
ncbi:hypothetical protein [Trichloromonas acetexigens]|uniref:Uncharacterized protein n=1 Tax=Trichloromonas acetexigens TaxID=38815 RepID=A0A550JJB7_9BACT|nr:hypothetical protein [Desulfuromonas acetexigens]TRO83273.1 hypothetical protein FL622_04100 [Desulfuromonas acetexigens]